MDHIFGDSDDIDFGSSSSKSHPASSSSAHSSSAPALSRPDRQMFVARTPAPRLATHTPTPVRDRDITPRAPHRPPSSDTTSTQAPPALSRLIASMKSSFLPREDDASSVRIVSLSGHTSSDPLFMIRSDDTTLLVGSGFGTMSRSGQVYQTFPDMRLIFSERDRIRAWILTDASIDTRVFEYILPTLGFPPIYATRDVIASFRNSITNTVFLDSCRFFEIFSDGMTSRKIGDIECIIADIDMTTHLGFKTNNTTFAFAHISLVSSDLGSSVTTIIRPVTD